MKPVFHDINDFTYYWEGSKCIEISRWDYRIVEINGYEYIKA